MKRAVSRLDRISSVQSSPLWTYRESNHDDDAAARRSRSSPWSSRSAAGLATVLAPAACLLESVLVAAYRPSNKRGH